MYVCKKCIEWKCYYKKVIFFFFKIILWIWLIFLNFVYKRYVLIIYILNIFIRWLKYYIVMIIKMKFIYINVFDKVEFFVYG